MEQLTSPLGRIKNGRLLLRSEHILVLLYTVKDDHKLPSQWQYAICPHKVSTCPTEENHILAEKLRCRNDHFREKEN